MGRDLQYRYVYAEDDVEEADAESFHSYLPYLSRTNDALCDSETLTHDEVLDRIVNLALLVKQKGSSINCFDELEAISVFAYFAKHASL